MPTRSSFNTTARWLMALFFIASGTAKVFAFQPAAAIMLVIAGTSSAAHLRENVAAATLRLPDDASAALKALT